MVNKEQHEAALARIDQLEKKLLKLTAKITAFDMTVKGLNDSEDQPINELD
jgi:hypothetical protein